MRLFLLLILLVTCGCSNASNTPYHPQEKTFDQKIKEGRNTGTPADMYNMNPFSVFDTYSPWNPFQNP